MYVFFIHAFILIWILCQSYQLSTGTLAANIYGLEIIYYELGNFLEKEAICHYHRYILYRIGKDTYICDF